MTKRIFHNKFILDKVDKFFLNEAFNTKYMLLKSMLVTCKKHQVIHKIVRDV